MNCKKGDLAIIVSSLKPGSPTIGKIVRCLEFIPSGTLIRLKDGSTMVTTFEGWCIDIMIPMYHSFTGELAGYAGIANDKRLRPLRDGDGEDETIKWAGKPVRETKEFNFRGSLTKRGVVADDVQDLKRKLK